MIIINQKEDQLSSKFVEKENVEEFLLELHLKSLNNTMESLLRLNIGKSFNPLVFNKVILYRYYGESWPLGKDSLELDNMRFLSVH